MALYWLSDEAWAAIEPHLPKNQPGARRVDDRRVISGIVHVLKVGCRWCDCPADYGPSTTIYNRFNRWSRRGFWLKLLDALVNAGVVAKSTAIDSTRGGSGNLNSGEKWIAGLTAAMLAASRRQDEQATAPEPQPGVQGQGGTGRRARREDAGRAGAAV